MPEPGPTQNSAQSAALFLKCIDFISDIVLITEAGPIDSPGPRVVLVNPAFERMTGYSAREIVGQTPRMLQGPRTDSAELQRIRTALVNWLPVRAELVNYKKNGDAFVVEMDIVPIGDETGRWTHWVSIQRDVTARKKAEADALAREAQRYESLATLSSGIAHDFNNIIAAILGNVAIGSADMKSGQMPTASMEQIKTAALRARGVVSKILAYGRRSAEVNMPVQLAPIVREATDLLRAILPVGVKLEVTCPSEPLWVRGDTSQLCQVLLNLGVNALQSMPADEGKGRIHFVLGTSVDPASGASAPNGRTATIQVSDTGCGMDAATQARMFQPYFTTKADGRGTGLGLAVVWGIVTAHGGLLAVDSEVGRGSRIALSLPLIDEEIAKPPPPPELAPAPAGAFGNGEHVLVVDDDEVVVVMLEGMLKRWGFRVTTLQDPLKAVSLVKGAPTQFDAVVTDLNMPHVSGLQLARDVLAVRHDMPVILGSGTVNEALVNAAAQAGIAAVFPKEFAVEQLGTLLKHTLAHSALTRDRNTAAPPPQDLRMHNFLINNRDELIRRCKSKVGLRSQRQATNEQLANGVPLVLEQLIRTLSAEEGGRVNEGLQISGPAGGDMARQSEIGVGATAHGKQLLGLGYSVDQVVHDYGDLCQAITDLALERDAPFSVDSYRTLNRCLDNAIADAVTEFAAQRDAILSAAQATEENHRFGVLAHELRNHLHVALLAFNAIESERLSPAGSTGAVLKRNLHRLEELIGQTLLEVRNAHGPAAPAQVFPLAAFIADAASIASLYAAETGCTLSVPTVDAQPAIRGNRDILLAALSNLLTNAFKFTKPKSEVTLRAHAAGGRIVIEVQDHCGGLPAGAADTLFMPFVHAKQDNRGLGLGLSIAAQGVKANGGSLSVRDVPGVGCVFTIDLPAESTANAATSP